ncbi:MAG: HEAT repeat domain-containing protein [Pseudomonadota bacterium]|nr:HEAT repeat domain-containing protein [Pseudomonadota bacterium]
MEYFFEQYAGFAPESFEHRLLVLLSDSVVALLLLALGFALLALWMRWQHDRHERRWRDLHSLWDGDVLDVLSGEIPPAEFRKRIAPEQELDFVRFLAPYGWRLRGSDLDTLKQLALAYMPHVVKQLKHKEPGVRAWAVNVIGLFGMPQYERSIVATLDDESAVVVMFAASTLLAQRRVHYIAPVLEQMQRFDRWNVNSAASLLANMGRDAIPVLESIYLDPQRATRPRVVAALALANFTDYAVADAAAALLPGCDDVELTVATLRLLSKVGQLHHRPYLKKLCESPVEALRIHALRTLRAVCTREDSEFLLKMLDDPSAWVARQAIQALDAVGAKDLLEELVNSGHPRALLARQMLGEHR